MLTPWALSTLLLACSTHGPGPGWTAAGDDHAADRAPIGVEVRSLPEGLLVEAVTPGGGAAAAGLGPGDLIVAVDGVEVRKAATTALQGLRGQAGSEAKLVIRAAEGGDYREVAVARQLTVAAITVPPMPRSVVLLRKALSRQGPGAVRRATRGALADDFGGLKAGETLGEDLRRAWRRRPAAALAAADLLDDMATQTDDLQLRRELGWLWLRAEQPERALPHLVAVDAARVRDSWEPGGAFVGEAGGGVGLRRDLVRALWQSNHQGDAITLARSLLSSWELPTTAGLVGMAPWRQTSVWRGRLAPLDDFSVRTLDGGRWTLEEHRGELVLINFFATWCRPCRDELPALAGLSAARGDAGLTVLGVSMDDDRDATRLPAFVDALGLPFPISHAPELGRRFQVDGIPALRLIDRDGGLLYAGQGYSPESFLRMVEVVEASLTRSAEPGAALGPAWSAGEARLSDFLGVAAVEDVAFADGELALGRSSGPPVVLPGASQGTDADAEGPPGGGLVVWFDGPVAATPGQHWLRATTPTGRDRWIFTTADPVTALAVDGELLWLATAGQLLAVDSLGRQVHRVAGGATDVAAHADGGVWAVDGSLRRRLDRDGSELRRDAAPGAVRVDSRGRVASGEFEQILTGRFGPDGALRSALVRADGTLIGLDGAGQPALTWQLADPPRLAAGDIDGDGQDELLVAVRDRGLATLTLSLP